MRAMRIPLAATVILGAFLASTANAADKVCKLEITGTDMMQFDKKELNVKADCTQVELTLKHNGKLPANAMGHNWVLTESSAFQSVASDGMSAGLAGNYVRKDDARVIAHTKVIGGGESASVTFPTSKLKKGGSYTFFCSFPGHWSLMKGTLTFG